MKSHLGFIFLWLCLTLMLSGCTTKLTYNWLDWGIQWKVGKLIPLDKTQKQILKTDIQAFHQWHRTEQLPIYASYLRQFHQRVQSGKAFSSDEIHGFTDDAQEMLDISLTHVIPDIEKLLVSLDEKQVAFLLKRLNEEREEYREEYIDITEKKRHKIRIKELTYYTRKLFGRLNEDQMAWLRAWAKSLTPYENLNAQQQSLWQEAITELLQRRKEPSGIRTELSNLMFYRTDNWQPELQKTMDTNQDLTYQLLAKLFNNLTNKQQARFESRLLSYAQDFEELSQSK